MPGHVVSSKTFAVGCYQLAIVLEDGILKLTRQASCFTLSSEPWTRADNVMLQEPLSLPAALH